MTFEPHHDAFERRITAIESRLDMIEFMLRDMREIFTQGYDTLSKANDTRREAIEVLRRRNKESFRRVGSSLLETWDFAGYLADKLRNTYEAVFPGRTASMHDEINRVLRHKPKGRGTG